MKLLALALFLTLTSLKYTKPPVVHYHFHGMPYNFMDFGQDILPQSFVPKIRPNHRLIFNDDGKKKKCPPKCGKETVPVCEALPGLHHFSVLDALVEPKHRLHKLAQQLIAAI